MRKLRFVFFSEYLLNISVWQNIHIHSAAAFNQKDKNLWPQVNHITMVKGK